MTAQIINGDALEQLRTLPSRSVRCCVTSPPYWGLRDYGVAGQIGLERTPEMFVAKLVDVFREVKRVLTDDGTLWLNIGDSYCAAPKGSLNGQDKSGLTSVRTQLNAPANGIDKRRNAGYKPKDLIGVPWMVAFALRADGWYLRSDVVWAKPNGMPESVKDRPARSHEYVFLLSKSRRYFYDWKAVRRPLAASSVARLTQPGLESQPGSARANGASRTTRPMKAVRFGGNKRGGGSVHPPEQSLEKNGGAFDDAGANLRDVWSIATQPFTEAHFAVMPPTLAHTCILAGSVEGDTVLDPFGGAGTTGLVADRLGRNAVLIELNPQYVQMAERRIHDDSPLFSAPAASEAAT